MINVALLLTCLALGAWQVAGFTLLEFSTGSQFSGDLSQARISDDLRKMFEDNRVSLSGNVAVSTEHENREWLIADHDERETYIVKQEEGRLNIYSRAALPFWLMVAVAALLGVMLVIPIGGADMPVVISLLNAYSGIAAAGHGWVLNNSVLIIAGSLVGAAGFILTALMSRAMNRSLANIIFAGVGAEVATEAETDDIYAGRVKAASPEEVAMMLDKERCRFGSWSQWRHSLALCW